MRDNMNELEKINEELKKLELNGEVFEFNQEGSNNYNTTLNKLKSKYPEYSLKHALSDKLTDEYWSNDINKTNFKSTKLKGNNVINNIENIFGDPTNIDDLQYFNDRVYAIVLENNIFGFIKIKATDDEIEESLEDENYEINEDVYLESNNQYFTDLLTLILEEEIK